jgi:hypothetical protein
MDEGVAKCHHRKYAFTGWMYNGNRRGLLASNFGRSRTLGPSPPLRQINWMTRPACPDLDRIEGEFENDGGPRGREPRYKDSLAGSIYLALIAEAERMPCKHCTWQRAS